MGCLADLSLYDSNHLVFSLDSLGDNTRPDKKLPLRALAKITIRYCQNISINCPS